LYKRPLEAATGITDDDNALQTGRFGLERDARNRDVPRMGWWRRLAGGHWEIDGRGFADAEQKRPAVCLR
jgi:hypothetical protein